MSYILISTCIYMKELKAAILETSSSENGRFSYFFFHSRKKIGHFRKKPLKVLGFFLPPPFSQFFLPQLYRTENNLKICKCLQKNTIRYIAILWLLATQLGTFFYLQRFIPKTNTTWTCDTNCQLITVFLLFVYSGA